MAINLVGCPIEIQFQRHLLMTLPIAQEHWDCVVTHNEPEIVVLAKRHWRHIFLKKQRHSSNSLFCGQSLRTYLLVNLNTKKAWWILRHAAVRGFSCLIYHIEVQRDCNPRVRTLSYCILPYNFRPYIISTLSRVHKRISCTKEKKIQWQGNIGKSELSVIIR